MKRAGAFLLLFLWLLQAGGVTLYYLAQLHHQRNYMRSLLQALPESKLTQLNLSADKFEVARVEEHELLLDGALMDIARIEHKGERVIVWGLWDDDENKILSQLRNDARRHTESGTPQSCVKQMISYICLEISSIATPLIFPDPVTHVSFLRCQYHSVDHSHESPPP